MEFKKIQLNGFKSFADKTSLLIEDGLTGIVGPNGCGKSNIVESLRWCMGETSAKSMRGSGMEDVIFSGTSNKPSKNIAEVVVNLSNDGSLGSHNYKHIPEIEIRRKIEKDKGSKFHINGKEVRAKDAQMFFCRSVYRCTFSINNKSRQNRSACNCKTYRQKNGIGRSCWYCGFTCEKA